MREHQRKCEFCGEFYDEDSFEECLQCGAKVCPSCLDTDSFGDPVCPACWDDDEW